MFPAKIVRGQALAGIHDKQASGYPTKAFGYDKNQYTQIPNRTILLLTQYLPEFFLLLRMPNRKMYINQTFRFSFFTFEM